MSISVWDRYRLARLKVECFAKIDIWALLPGLNIDLGEKETAPIASNRPQQCAEFFFRDALRHLFSKRTPPPPLLA